MTGWLLAAGVVGAVAVGGFLFMEGMPGKQPAESPNLIAGRYIDHGNGTITDTQSSLMWKKCSEGQSDNTCNGEVSRYEWDDAMSRFKGGVSFAGYSDWRMPTKEELKSLVYCSNGKNSPWSDFEPCGDEGTYQRPTINQQAFPNTPNAWFWSSSSYANDGDNDAWFVGFDYGYGSYGYKGNVLISVVRLVRSGK